MYDCMYVCMYVFMYACMYVYFPIQALILQCMYDCMYVLHIGSSVENSCRRSWKLSWKPPRSSLTISQEDKRTSCQVRLSETDSFQCTIHTYIYTVHTYIHPGTTVKVVGKLKALVRVIEDAKEATESPLLNKTMMVRIWQTGSIVNIYVFQQDCHVSLRRI